MKLDNESPISLEDNAIVFLADDKVIFIQTEVIMGEFGVDSRLHLTDGALRVLEARYLKKDELKNLTETPEDMFRRVANAVATAELSYDTKEDIKAIEDEFYRDRHHRRPDR